MTFLHLQGFMDSFCLKYSYKKDKQCFDLEIKQELDTSTCFHVSDTPTSFNHVIQNGVFGEKQYFVLLECLSFSHQISRAGIKLFRRSSSLLLTRFYSPPLTALSEEEQMMKDTGQCYWPRLFHVLFYSAHVVARFANERVKPLVQEMDRDSQMSKDIIRGMFDQGVMIIIIILIN